MPNIANISNNILTDSGVATSSLQPTITLTTTGTSGASTLISNTLNIPNYGSALTGYVPTSRQLTINGTAYDLSADRTWSVGTVTSVAALTLGTTGTDLSSSVATGTTTPVITLNVPTASAANRGALSAADWSTFNTKVGGVTATSPLFSSGGSTPNITIQQSSGSQAGYLSSTDWTTFNNKQAAGNYITSLTGEATATGPGAAAVTLDNASVTAKILTGVNITGGTVLSTDTMLTAFGKLQNQINGLIGGSIYQGTWNASTNTPTLTSSVGTQGYYYIVSVAGTTNLNGITDWFVGDWAIFNGGVWQQVDNTDAVVSVNGQTGAVSLTTDNISEGVTNLYFTNTRARAALSFVAGSGAYNSSTGAITIPTNTSQLTNGANFITLASLSGTAPITYNSGTGAISITQAATASNGYLSSTDWNTFNNKQVAGNYVTIDTTQSISGLKTFTSVITSTVSAGDSLNLNKPTGPQITLNKTNATAQSWGIAADSNFRIINITLGNNALSFDFTTNSALFNSSVTSTSFIKTGGTSSQFLKADGSVDSTSYQSALTLTTTGSSGAATLVGATLNIPNYGSALTGYVPYTGATGAVTLGAFSLTATGITVNKSAGISTITFPAGTNDPAYIQHDESTPNTGIMRFSVGDDNDATDYFVFGNVSGGFVERFKILSNGIVTLGTWQATAIADAYIASAATWNAKQNAITLTTTGTSGAATLVGATLNVPNYSFTETDTLQTVILRNGTTNTGFTIENANSTYSTPASTNVPIIYMHNTSTSLTAHAILSLRTMGPTGGDPFLSLDIDGVIGWHVGVDNSDGDTFKIGKSWATVGDNTYLSIDTSGNTVFAGNVTIQKTTPGLILNGIPFGSSGAYVNFQGWAASNANWQIGVANIGPAGLLFTPSTAAGGTTFSSPVFTLSDAGAGTFSSSVTAAQFLASSSGNAAIITSTGISGYGLVASGSAGGARDIFLAGQSGYSNGFTVKYTGSSMLYTFQDGNVLIGTTNTSTGHRLTVYSATETAQIRAAGAAPAILFTNTDTNTNSYSGYVGIATAANNFMAGTAAGDMVVQNYSGFPILFGIGNVIKMRIEASGQLVLTSTISNGTYTYTLPSATGTLALTSALSGYLPLTGGTLTGQLNLTYASARTIIGDGTNSMVIGLWDGTNCRIETSGRPLYMVSYGGTISIGRSGYSSLVVDATTTSFGSSSFSAAGVFTGTSASFSGNSLRVGTAGGDSAMYIGPTGVEAIIAYNNTSGDIDISPRQTFGTYFTKGTVRIAASLGVGNNTSGFGDVMLISNTNANVYPRVNRSSTSYEAGWKLSTGGTDSWYLGLRSTDGVGSYHFYSYTTNSSVVSITNGGNVLIGTSTDAGQKLQVNGVSLLKDAVRIDNGTSGTSPKLTFGQENETFAGFKGIYLESFWMYIQVHYNEGLRIKAVNGAGASQTIATFAGSAGTLVTLGSITSGGGVTASGDITANAGAATAITVYNASSIRAKLSMTGNEGDLSLYGSSANRLVYLSAYYDSYVNGKISVGTTTNTSQNLTVYSATGAGQVRIGGVAPTIYFTDVLTNPANYIGLVGLATQTNNFFTGTAAGDFVMYNSASGYKLFVVNYSGGVYLTSGATSWTANSDIRLKNINSHIENAVEKLSTLQTINFSYKDDKFKKQNLGLIAQEVEKIFPELIDKNNDGMLGVRYTELVPVLIKAVQELKEEINQLKQLKNK